MVLLAHQVGVALADACRIAIIQIRIEEPDAWAIDAHVVTQAEVYLIGYSEAKACRRH